MGTNYYLVKTSCKGCGRVEEIHIGKSSVGWCFTLATHNDPHIKSLDDWLEVFTNPAHSIRDEYGECIHQAGMIRTILCRSLFNKPGYSTGWYATNNAVPGPNHLVRHRIDGFCIAHGGGTYDLIAPDRDFS